MPAGTAVAAALSAPAIKKVGEFIVKDLYELAKRRGRRWKATAHASTLYKRVRQLRLVKTIWQSEKEVDLTKFYHPSKIWVDRARVEIHQLADLGWDGSVVLEGTVGQGKSILLRYLSSVEFCITQRVPLFVELRKIRDDQSLHTLIATELATLGFDADDKFFDWMAEEGKIVLLLDAFDEIKNELRSSVLADIENLVRRHERLRVVVSSRPDSGVSHSPFLRVFALCPLEGREYESVIDKMSHNKETASAIIAGVRRDSSQVVPLLTTPLMVALLMIRFRIDQSLPNNIAAFYESLFMLLLQRHDKTKGGYTRPRKSQLSDTELENTFNSLAFLTRKVNEASFSRTDLDRYGREAIKLAGMTANVDNVLADIVEVTCLILAEGEERRFIHKSVQEYHAALFIKSQPDATAAVFYQAMRTKWFLWLQELNFLEIIDQYRFLKHFHIPMIHSMLGVSSGIPEHINLTKDELIDRCGKDELRFRRTSPGEWGFTFSSSSHHWATRRLISHSPYANNLFQLSFNKIKGSNLRETGAWKLISVREMMGIAAIDSDVQKICRKFLAELLPELRNAEAYVRQVDERKEAFNF